MKKETENLKTELTEPPVGGTIQIGSIVAYFGSTAPDTWLLCDGAAIPSDYGDLITMVGLNTPNLCGRTLIGAGTTTDSGGNEIIYDIGDSGGATDVTLKLTQIPSHQHFGFGESSESNWETGNSTGKGYTGSGDKDTDNYLYGSTFTGGNPGDVIATTNTDQVTGKSAGSTDSHNNMQPYFVINYIIYAGTK